jgi:hypothetical protein
MQLMRITRTLCGAGVLTGLLACLPADAKADPIPVQTLTYRVVDDQPAPVETETVSFQRGFYGRGLYGGGFYGRGFYGRGIGFGFGPSYYGYSYYRPYGSFYGAPYYGYSYYRPWALGYSYYRPRYYGYSYYNPAIYGYAYHQPLYYRPFYGSYFGGYSPGYAAPAYHGGTLYHGSFGYGSACCDPY